MFTPSLSAYFFSRGGKQSFLSVICPLLSGKKSRFIDFLLPEEVAFHIFVAVKTEKKPYRFLFNKNISR
jgi:hypothetical protein